MRFELFVALRYLFARRKQAFIYIISAMSVLGVAIGVAALVVVLGVYNGFTTDIRDKILGANAHIIVSGPLAALTAPPSDADFEKMRGGEAPELSGMAAVLRRINATPGVVGSTPFLYAEGMLSSPRGVKGVVLRGIDPKTAPDVLTMLDNLSSGSVADLNASVEGAPPACSSARNWRSASAWSWAAASTSFRLPDKRPPPVSSPASVPTRLRAFSRPACSNTIRRSGSSPLRRRAICWACLPIRFPASRSPSRTYTRPIPWPAALQKELGPLASVRTWMDMNANLFAALKLEKIGMFILLAMVVLIGSFSIVTTLVMLVMEKTHDIAILMSMGATKGMIRRIFMLQGTIIGVVGTLLGYVLGIGLALLLQRYQFIKLPPGVYTLDHLPILLNWVDIVVVGVSAMTLCFLATIYPARQASSLEPAEALRFE